MKKFVLDCSVTMHWCFEEEVSDFSRKVLLALKNHQAYVPELWPLEVANVLLVGERRKRLSKADTAHFLEMLADLPIQIESTDSRRIFQTIFPLARQYSLSSYDAAYLDCAMRLGCPLATLDQPLQRAAKMAGVALFE